jgi:hypothetical protein
MARSGGAAWARLRTGGTGGGRRAHRGGAPGHRRTLTDTPGQAAGPAHARPPRRLSCVSPLATAPARARADCARRRPTTGGFEARRVRAGAMGGRGG